VKTPRDLIVPFEDEPSQGLMDIACNAGTIRVSARTGGKVRLLVADDHCEAGGRWIDGNGKWLGASLSKNQALALILALSAATREEPIINKAEECPLES